MVQSLTRLRRIRKGIWSDGIRRIYLSEGTAEYDHIFNEIRLDSATASRLLATDSSKYLESVAALTSWIAGTTDSVTVTDDGDGTVTLNLVPIYGEIHASDNSTVQSIPTGVTYTKIENFDSNGESSNITPDYTNNKITITKTGIYNVAGSFSMESGTALVEWKGAAFLDGSEQHNCHWQKLIATANDSGFAGFNGIIDVTSVPVDLDVRVRHDNGGSIDFLMVYGNLNIKYLGPT